MPSPALAAANPLQHSPIKRPDRCPHCNALRLIKKGTREKKLERIPILRCLSCGRSFTVGPRPIRNKTYPVNEILEALTLYNRGYSLEETARKISSRFGRHAAPSTVARWLAEYPSFTTYTRLRARGHALYKPMQTSPTIKLYHRQVYEFGWHRSKLAFVRSGTLDDKRVVDKAFAGVADFVESIPTTCPHDLFRRDDGARGSELLAGFVELDNLIVVEKQNAATEMATLVVPATGSNFERHSKLQRFLLTNDSTTIAVEVPIWLDEEEITFLESKYGRQIVPKEPLSPNDPDGPHKARHLTGHIDFLQVRNGALHVLDYKPAARTEKPIAQLTIYALALTVRVPGLKLFDIKCAWFNEERYCEFFPRKLFPLVR
jgi:hypothetical protein